MVKGISAVRVLFFECGPTAVAQFVIAVGIHSIYRLAFRPFAHIRHKVGERPPLSWVPTFADYDVSPSVALPVVRIRITAAVKHAKPRTISWSSWSQMLPLRPLQPHITRLAQSLRVVMLVAAKSRGDKIQLHREFTPSGVMQPSVQRAAAASILTLAVS